MKSKTELAVADLVARGVRRSTAAPPLYRLLWWLGVSVPPPLFQSFLALAALSAFLYGALLTIVFAIALLLSAPTRAPISEVLLVTSTTSAIAGLVFGPVIALYYRWYARHIRLPSWEEYAPGESEEDEPDW